MAVKENRGLISVSVSCVLSFFQVGYLRGEPCLFGVDFIPTTDTEQGYCWYLKEIQI